MPSRATSVAVSKPRPNRKPSGSMCQLRETSRNIGRNSRASSPRLFSSRSKSCIGEDAAARGRGGKPPDADQDDDVHRGDQRTGTAPRPRCRRCRRCPSVGRMRRRARSSSPAMPSAASTTTVEWPRAEPEADADRALALLHQLAGDVVDGGDVVGVHRVAQAEAVGQQRGAEQHRLVAEGQQRPGPDARGWRRSAARRRRSADRAGRRIGHRRFWSTSRTWRQPTG